MVTWTGLVLLVVLADGRHPHATSSPPLHPIPPRRACSGEVGCAERGPRCYQPLTAHDVQAQAAQSSSVATLLQLEKPRGGRDRLLSRASNEKRRAVHKRVLDAVSEETRNRTAVLALETYHRLADALDRGELLRPALAITDRLVGAAEDLEAANLRGPADLAELRKQRLDLIADGERLTTSLDDLDAQLRGLLGWPVESCRAWPVDRPVVHDEPLDEDTAACIALRCRPDVSLLRTLIRELDEDNAPEIRRLLTTVHPLLEGTTSPVRTIVRLFLGLPQKARPEDVERTRAQLRVLLVERERQAIREAHAAVRQVCLQVRLHALALERLRVFRARVGELEEREKAGQPVREELPRARLAALRAEGEVLERRTAWAIARVQLAGSMGLLGKGAHAPSRSPP